MSGEPAIITDEELARQAQAGSLAAFDQLVGRHHSRLYYFLCQKAPTLQDAEDITQQTFITAHRRLHQFRLEARFATWLFTIARRLAINHYRARAVRPVCELEEAATMAAPGHDPAATMVETEERDLLWRVARESLVEPQFTALWLHYREHLSVEAIARVMGRTQVSVKVLMHRARKRLAQVLPGQPAGASGAEGNPQRATEWPSARPGMELLLQPETV